MKRRVALLVGCGVLLALVIWLAIPDVEYLDDVSSEVSQTLGESSDGGEEQTVSVEKRKTAEESTKKPNLPSNGPDGGIQEESLTNEPICFPYTVPGTTLVIKSLESYDGIFLEDGSDREITGAAAAIIYNEGDTPVEYAVIRLENGEMEFVVTALESGGTVVVQESKAAPYANKEWYECSAEIAYMNEMEMPDGKVVISETESGALEIRNISDACIPCVRIFYKFYMQEQSLYVGGITYQFKVLTLESGAVKTVTPAHYAAGHSKLIMVKTYDEEN